jgi:hypothetical protein
MKAKGFNLLRWNKNVTSFDCVGRHLLDPVDSTNTTYITSCVKEQLKGTSVTVVLIGKDTASSDWVADEIAWSLEKGNGVVGITLEPENEVPTALLDCGAEIVGWDPHAFADCIERAALAAKRSEAIAAATTIDNTCGR